MTYEEIMAKARKLAAEGNVEAAKRAMAMADAMKSPEAAEDVKPNPDGTYGEPPEGYILDPNTGAMTSQDLQANRMRPGALEAARIGTEEGIAWGGRDEATGAIAAATPFLPGTAGEQYDMAQLRARAELEAARRDHPAATMGGEMAGSVLTGGAAGKGLARMVGRVAPGVAQAVGNVAGRNLFTRGLAGGATAAPAAGLYGYNAGEGDERLDGAKQAGLWGFGLGSAGSIASDAVGAGTRMRQRSKAVQQMLDETPSTEELLSQGGQMIEDAASKGTTARPDQTADLAKGFLAQLQRDGYITPKGRTLTGDAARVQNVIDAGEDYFMQSMTPAQMQQFRKVAQRAARSTDAEEARTGTRLLKQFDEWADPLMPGAKEGRAVYAKGKRGEEIDKLVALAQDDAGQFSGSGYENALQTRFRQHAREISKGRHPEYTDEQIEAIRKVARPSGGQQMLRTLGKSTPSNAINIGVGGGLPLLAGASAATLGVPQLAIPIAAGTMGVGALARRAATKAQQKNVAVAGAMARGGKIAERTPEQLLAEQNKRAIVEQLLRYGMLPTVTQ